MQVANRLIKSYVRLKPWNRRKYNKFGWRTLIHARIVWRGYKSSRYVPWRRSFSRKRSRRWEGRWPTVRKRWVDALQYRSNVTAQLRNACTDEDNNFEHIDYPDRPGRYWQFYLRLIYRRIRQLRWTRGIADVILIELDARTLNTFADFTHYC